MTKKRRRPIHLHVMVSEEELALIRERMAEAGIRNMGAYMRKMALNGYVLHVDLSPVRELQNFVSTKANIVSDILNNIQSLYKVANKQEIIKIQDEFYDIYETEDVAKLQRFSRQLDMIAENYKAQSI